MMKALTFVVLAACAVEDDATVAQDLTGGSAIGEPRWSVWLGNCSASILNERWLLTDSECVPTPGLGLVTVTSVVPDLGYNGLARKYVHPQASSIYHGLALIYLDERGLDLSSLGRAKLYSDARRPWYDESEPDELAWAGWGTTGAGCATSSHQLRYAATRHQRWYEHVATSWKDGITECPGDRGGQHLVSRGGQLLQFAVHDQFDYITLSTGQSIPLNFGTLYSENRAWIEDTIYWETSRAFGTTWTTATAGGYQYRESKLVFDGFEPIGGFEYRCMDIGRDGTIEMRTCSGADSQKWAFPFSGEVLAYNGLSRERKCLTIDGTAVGSRLRVKPCDGTNYQHFAYTLDGRLRSSLASTRCLKVAASGDGQPVVVAQCQTNNAQQMWSTSPIPPV